MKPLFSTKKTYSLVAVFLLSSLIFSACKKDNGNGTGYSFTFKANGTAVVLNLQSSMVAAFAHSASVYNAVFSGSDGVSSMNLQVFDGKNISDTTYSGYTLVGSSIVGALIDYQDASGTDYTQGTVNSNATVTITELTATTVRGTFSGTLKASGKPDILITDGEFFIWRAN